ncbi:ABC1 kinase family protein [Ornithinimicrobium cryptoxanthini]|uniref:AarF/ABC1/UbiB kinase family protein n=1 Tax=Ornithinimicrobium cryptoxanthini TaxID=2934161 RepID=A0ABY4YFK2_9MICO|nr:AarF/ABC1/UbiB kinase family protein [Ornithinimicrobium cryptoxanthini]USQ75541.1 AarF/ABC1/UbiB kinase family protein [Ornithinimicrobium cryptoxanthini]
MTEPPQAGLARAARLSTLPLGVAARAVRGVGRRLSGQSAEDVLAQRQADSARQLFEVLGGLKGGAMKVGQFLSLMESALPPDQVMPYRESLTRLQSAAPAMSGDAVGRVLGEELGEDWRSLFASFDESAAAAASIGQVHRAVWRDGRPVAVKVQYPGAEKALMADLTALSRFARVSAGLVPGLDLAPILAELRRRLREEVDYRLEADAQEQFGQFYANDPTYAVPGVVRSGQRVLVSEWLDGVPLSTLIDRAPQADRDRAAAAYLRLLLEAPQRAGLLHADPHPGNFLLLADGRLGVLDYGAVNRLPDGLPDGLSRVLGAAAHGDAEELVEVLRDEGFVRGSVAVDAEAVRAFVDRFLGPLQAEEFTFSRDWMREMFADLQDPRTEGFRVGLTLNLPPQYVLIQRVWLGGLAVLSQLEATVPMREIVRSAMPGSLR